MSRANLAAVYALTGEKDSARKWLDRAYTCETRERSWETTMDLTIASASMALMLGDVTLALELTESAEKTALGKEKLVPNAGPFDKLMVFRALHAAGPKTAALMAEDACVKYRERHPLYYLDALAAKAWLENLTSGRYSPDTGKELEGLADALAPGKYAVLAAQGFLPRRDNVAPGRTHGAATQTDALPTQLLARPRMAGSKVF